MMVGTVPILIVVDIDLFLLLFGRSAVGLPQNSPSRRSKMP